MEAAAIVIFPGSGFNWGYMRLSCSTLALCCGSLSLCSNIDSYLIRGFHLLVKKRALYIGLGWTWHHPAPKLLLSLYLPPTKGSFALQRPIGKLRLRFQQLWAGDLGPSTYNLNLQCESSAGGQAKMPETKQLVSQLSQQNQRLLKRSCSWRSRHDSCNTPCNWNNMDLCLRWVWFLRTIRSVSSRSHEGVCSYMCLGFLFALFWFLSQGLTLLGENSLHSTSWPWIQGSSSSAFWVLRFHTWTTLLNIFKIGSSIAHTGLEFSM